jgi:hypothetical protein
MVLRLLLSRVGDKASSPGWMTVLDARRAVRFLLRDRLFRDAQFGQKVNAWVAAWTGGWWAYDPTNDVPVGERR